MHPADLPLSRTLEGRGLKKGRAACASGLLRTLALRLEPSLIAPSALTLFLIVVRRMFVRPRSCLRRFPRPPGSGHCWRASPTRPVVGTLRPTPGMLSGCAKPSISSSIIWLICCAPTLPLVVVGGLGVAGF